jgi:hypothetical protein
MTWAGSAMFAAWAQGVMGQGQTAQVLPAASGNASLLYAGLGADTVNAALFNNTTTPDKTAARTSTGYNTGQWVTGNEVTDATNWVAGGRALGSKTTNVATNVFTFSAANTAGGGTLTISNAFGCLLYDNNITAGTGGVAKQGVTFHDFGGSQSVTSGTFTIVWNASGIFTITV